ncbi:hypothetical protein MVEN_01065600 [Mycena venus]|uniref:F-box domain-containing protein n=1 Tax=Mycena venus TaxID=2733690 RepID=A0A8H7CZM3_9AGAR|nr:hypothetical protein MVEN_01065600 [Mycena venus]
MSGIGLVPDILNEVMLRLPLDIAEKFAFAQVSRLWRDLALDNRLFWSSFTGDDSKADCYRVPLVLERSGSQTLLHIQFRFSSGKMVDWPTDALNALVPYVARIVTLDIEFTAPMDVKALLNSGLEFPVLQTLRLKSSIYRNVPGLLLTAPNIQTLDIERIHLTNWGTLLCPSLENIKLCDSPVEMLLEILKRCPRVWRIVLRTWYPWSGYSIEDSFAAFPSRPLAPALRELDLQIRGSDLIRVLEAGFSDVVLHSLTGCIYNGHGEDDVEILSGALLPGVGSLVLFKLVDMQDVELRDEAGRIRHLQCWDTFEVRRVWGYLSLHYGLHKTVREIQIRPEHWHAYLEIFESYPSQQEGITLAIDTGWSDFPLIQDGEGDLVQASKVLRMPGLAKVKFCGSKNSEYFIQTILDVLALIEPPTVRKVEVCIELTTGAQDVLRTLQSTWSDCWAICSHCAE